jgi:hypothetical protein
MSPTQPSAAQAKIGRARQHGLDLQARIIGWSANADPRLVASIADDRLSWAVRLSEFDPPPLGEWALILGDSIHNLRSALDVLVWSYVDENALTERQAKTIAFPIWMESTSWDNDAERLLRTVPAAIVQRIHECQPFQRPEEERSGDLLPLLAELDNRDKHRIAITTGVQVNPRQFTGSIGFRDEEAAARNVPPDTTVHEPVLTSGALLLTGTTKDPIVTMKGTGDLQAQIGMDPGNGFVGVIELIDRLVTYTAQVVAHVSS